jgi:hypothetical protein
VVITTYSSRQANTGDGVSEIYTVPFFSQKVLWPSIKP